jgi:hypothetical protein
MSAFNKKTWHARLGAGLNKFLDIVSGKYMQFESAPDTITQEGTPLSADNLNDLETRIDEGFDNYVPNTGGTYYGPIYATGNDRIATDIKNSRVTASDANTQVATNYILFVRK